MCVFTEDVDLFKLVDVFEYEGRTDDELLLFRESMLEQESFLLTFVGLTHSALNPYEKECPLIKCMIDMEIIQLNLKNSK